MEVNPLSIILVKSDSKGDRLLFRYPYQHDYQHQHSSNRRHQHHHRVSPGSGLNGHHQHNSSQRPRNPYAIGGGGGGWGFGAGGAAGEDPLQSTPPQTSNIEAGQLCGFTDEVLSTLFAVKPELCNRKFELKVNDVRFVAHPTLMQANQPATEAGGGGGGGLVDATTTNPSSATDALNASMPNAATAATATTSSAAAATAAVPGSSILINIVFALHAQASYSIVKCYYELSKRLGHALVYEEQRVGYLSAEMATMVKSHDEIAGVMAHSESGSGGGAVGVGANAQSNSGGSGAAKAAGPSGDLNGSGGGGGGDGGIGATGGDGATGAGNTECGVGSGRSQQPSAFDLILERCTLAQCLKNIYHDLCTTGLLNITINQWVTLSFCLPQKAHQFHKRGVVVEPEAIDRCLQSLKPYHGMLLLVDLAELLDCFPPSGARMLLQLLNAYNPLKTLQNMASEADLDIKHVYELVGHLVYWAKATIIYPLCETNVYVIAPDAPLHSHSPLVEKFSGKFPGMSLFEVISDFSLPTSIGHLTTPLQHPTRQGTLAQMVLWMLQHHLLMQLHTYVQFMPTEHGECSSPSVSCSEEEVCGAEQKSPETDGRDDDDDVNLLSQLTISSSQPMAVPNTSRRSLTDDPSTTTSDDAADDVVDPDDQNGASSLLHLQSATFGNQQQQQQPQQTIGQQQQSPQSSSAETTTETESESLAGSVEDEDKIRDLLLVFREPERSAVRDLSAASNAEDLALMVKLWQAGYFKGEHHLEEIMYFENLRRSQLLQLLDKFRDVLIIYETEDPAIATLYTQTTDC